MDFPVQSWGLRSALSGGAAGPLPLGEHGPLGGHLSDRDVQPGGTLVPGGRSCLAACLLALCRSDRFLQVSTFVPFTFQVF